MLSIRDNSPPPLDPLEHVVISPENIEIERRQATAEKVPLLKRIVARGRIRSLNRQLRRSEWDAIHAQRQELKTQLIELREQYRSTRARLYQNPDDVAIKKELVAIRRKMMPLMEQWRSIESRWNELAPVARERQKYIVALENHAIAVRRERLHRQERKRWELEAKIYERLMIHKLTALGYAHRYSDKHGNHQVDEVEFETVTITEDAIYYKVDAAYQTTMKAWKTNLPNGVRVVHDILNPETLDEMTITCQRQVSGVWSANGAWLIVHRLDAADGLMNFVGFDNVMEYYPHKNHKSFPICVGVGLHRQVQWTNLADYPHWLIGGLTGGGKSNMINAALATMISMHTPMDLRVVLIDLKGGLEFDFYQGIPHLYGDIIDTVPKVRDVLHEMEALMHDRFKRARGVAKSLREYQTRRPNEYMPRVVIVFDEVASIMDHGDTTKQILASLRELTRMGRAVGIHVFLCTQRPDVKAIEGSIKVNLAVRMSGRMPSSSDSVTILGNNLAANLAAVPGRMVFQLGPDPQQVQTPFISNENLAKALEVALDMEPPPALDVPEGAAQRHVHQEWTVERIIELSINHLGGNITWKHIYEAADDLSQSQARKLVEEIWSMDVVEFDGKAYTIQRGRGHQKRLVEIEDEQDEDAQVA